MGDAAAFAQQQVAGEDARDTTSSKCPPRRAVATRKSRPQRSVPMPPGPRLKVKARAPDGVTPGPTSPATGMFRIRGVARMSGLSPPWKATSPVMTPSRSPDTKSASDRRNTPTASRTPATSHPSAEKTMSWATKTFALAAVTPRVLGPPPSDPRPSRTQLRDNHEHLTQGAPERLAVPAAASPVRGREERRLTPAMTSRRTA